MVEEGVLVELHQEKSNKDFSVGDIYVGQVKKVVPGLNAAFVDIGFEKDAFLHYTDLSPQVKSFRKYVANIQKDKWQTSSLSNFPVEPDIVKTGKIEEVLSKKDHLLVQVLKEPISSKGPRLTCEITLAGRYVVVAPFGRSISISKKIKSPDERKRLTEIATAICPENYGMIVRTAAEGKKANQIQNDIKRQIDKWQKIYEELQHAAPPEKVLSETNKSAGILRDFMHVPFDKIMVNDRELTEELKAFIYSAEPGAGKERQVSYYNKRTPIFDYFKVNRGIKSSFGKTVNMPSGAYLVIEHTEAMHVIDVNSGYKMGSNSNQETNAITVNLEAINEISRQLRLRDLGGLIVIDFIDVRDPDHKKMIFRRMKEAMEEDRARHTILPLSKFGLMQITRERTRPEIKISTAERCPCCKGTGKVKATILLVDELESNMSYMLKEMNFKNLRLTVHPFVEAFIKRGMISLQWKWFWKFKKWIVVDSNENYHLTQYLFHNDKDEEIKL